MAEPSITSAPLAAAGLVALFPGVDAGIVLGAFAGAAVFVLSSTDYKPLQKLAFLVLATVAGMLAAPMAASLLATLLPASVAVPQIVGALLAAALSIRLLMRAIKQAENLQFPQKGGGQ